MVYYYKYINGEKYDKKLLTLANKMSQERRDGRISQEDMIELVNNMNDASYITEIETNTLNYIFHNYNLTNLAKQYFNENVDTKMLSIASSTHMYVFNQKKIAYTKSKIQPVKENQVRY